MAQALALPTPGVLRVIPPAQFEEMTQRADVERARAEDAAKATATPDVSMTDLAAFIRTRYEVFRSHRNSSGSGWSERLLAALRAFNGQYEPAKLAEIRKFGGSEVYARTIAMKCRGASSLLRDVYLAPDRPWGISAPADPDVPPEVSKNIEQLILVELQTMEQGGETPDAGAIRDRVMSLMDAARTAAKKQADRRANIAQDKIDELLQTGGFYKAMAEFLVDLPLFPFAAIKGPVVRIIPTVSWESGRAAVTQKARLFWQRVSPFDVYFTPGVADIEDAEVIERTRLTRTDLNDIMDLPGYNQEAVRAVLDEYGRGGLFDNWDSTDSERAEQENRENPHLNQSGIISCLEYHGNVQGRLLRQYGLGEDMVQDELRDYAVQAWLIGRHVIKCQLSPSPRRRHPYFITSFEKVPGTPVGNGLPDILSDIQDVTNASLRALVNNLSIASGPQVVVNVDRLAPGENGDELFPWKRWHVESDPMGNNTQEPISFFQPNDNSASLLGTFRAFSEIADELSAIPKYLSGNSSGGAGRTAAGLAMLMGNASKILQTVAANVDRDVLEPALTGLFDMLMLTDESGTLQGDETIRVMGVNVALQRETQRSRQLELLQVTGNPIDAKILGTKGRAALLRAVSKTVGVVEEIVPTEAELQELDKQIQAEAAAEAQGDQPKQGATKDAGPRARIGGGVG